MTKKAKIYNGEETVLASFVIDELAVGVWVEFQAFYPVPLMSLSIFVPIPYGFDDCCFVVESEVREPDSSSSIFLFQDIFGYSGSFVLLNFKIFCLSSVKNVLGDLIGIEYVNCLG